MPTKIIISGAIAALAVATLTANAATSPTGRAQGSIVSLVAATGTVAKADRDAVTIATRVARPEATPEPAAKPVVAVKPAAPRPALQFTAACQQAINSLKALHQADVTEDAAERAAGGQTLSASALLAERTEDAAEVVPWRNALVAARTACVPAVGTACSAAVASLQALLQASRTQEPADWAQLRTINWTTELTTLRTAFGTVATACADRD